MFDNDAPRMNKISTISLAIQIAFLAALGIDWIGLSIPILREVVAFLYLTFVPGIIILQLLNTDLAKLNTYLYAIGISIILTTFTGFFISLLYPLLGIEKPFSVTPLTTTIIVIVTSFWLLAYKRRNIISSHHPDFKISLHPSIFFLALLPFLAAIGAYLVHYHSNNVLLIILLILIGSIPILVALNKIPDEFLPLAVFNISMALLLHNFLSVPYLLGQDIHIEYYFVNIVYLNSRWNPSFEYPTNSILTGVILAPIYSKVLDLSLVLIVKTVYPFLFSVALVALYQAFKSQINEKMAFLSCFFFASIYLNYRIMYIKHTMVLFFTSLLVLLIVDKNLNTLTKKILLICFAVGLIISHYGIPYLFLFSLIFATIFASFIKKKIKSFESNFLGSSNFIIFFAGLAISWHIYSSGGTGFEVIVRAGERIVSSIMVELFMPLEGSGIYALTVKLQSWEWEVLRYLNILTQTFIFIGFFTVLHQKLTNKRGSVSNEFLAYSAAFLAFLGMNLVVPILQSGVIALGRIYNFSLLFLAPYCIIGGMKIIALFNKFKVEQIETLKILAIFFAVFMLFNTQLIMEVNREMFDEGYAKSASLSQPRILNGKASPEEIDAFFRSYSSFFDVQGLKWLKEYKQEGKKIAVDSCVRVTRSFIPRSDIIYLDDISSLLDSIRKRRVYVYLGESNVKYGFFFGKWDDIYWRASEIIYREENKIYSNSGSVIYENSLPFSE